MGKENRANPNRGVQIGQDATSNIIVTGDRNVVNIGGHAESSGATGSVGTPKVFLSSTSEDLEAYRAAAHDAAVRAGILPLQMESFAASGEHPPLEACLHKVSEANVLVLIVAHRYGWVPPEQDGGQDKSITWLECERAVADKKEILAFLVDEKHPWDPQLKEEHRVGAAISEGKLPAELADLLIEVQRNVKRLKDFKAWINSIGIRATFTTPQDLGWKVAEALRDWKQRHAGSGKRPGKRVARKEQLPPSFPPLYREWLRQQCADVDLLGVRVRQGQAVKLNHIYVPLTTTHEQEEPPGEKPRPKRPRPDQLESREKPCLLLDQLDKHSLYVPGDPGSGKSTFCRWVAWLVAFGSMPSGDVPVPEDYVEPFPQSLAPRLPVLFRLRDAWHCLPPVAGRETLSKMDFESALARFLDNGEITGLDWACVAAHLERGSALLIFDGVDEVPLRIGEGRQAVYPRRMLLSGLSSAAASWQSQGKGNRLLITSRPYGIEPQHARGLPMPTATIRELDETLQQLLVHRWFHVLKDDADQAARTASEMLDHLAGRPELGELTSNPMLMTAMCVIYNQGARLPQDKHDLYEQIVDNVLYNRYRNDPTERDMARQHLSVVACGMHTGIGLGQQRVTPQADASYRDVERMIQAFHDVSPVTYEGYRNALDTRDELLQRSGLLLSRGDRKAGFYHYTFQDFLAARRLADMQRDRLFDIICERAETDEWRNTLSFLFSGELAGSREQATRLLNRLIERLSPETIGLAVVVADCLETMRGRENRLRADVEQKFKTICLSAIENEVKVKARHTLGLALGHLGDPRIVEDLRDKAAYVEIPAGPYRIGDNDKKSYEPFTPLSEQTYEVEAPFLLSRYPVTNSQFALFIKDKGYTNNDLWSTEGWKWQEKEKAIQPRLWSNSKWNGPNQPVVGVSFYEAEAFCKWAGGFLPSEKQWEAAARGKSGHEYPWGGPWEDGICNSEEAGLKVTSPVGLFPRSKSVDFGLEDMAGNVWQWCQDVDTTVWPDGRVLRGGSFGDIASWVRGASRFNHSARLRYHINGFRVARTYR